MQLISVTGLLLRVKPVDRRSRRQVTRPGQVCWKGAKQLELAHLVHPNHSRAFWQLVERHCPAYARQRTWLKAKALELL